MVSIRCDYRSPDDDLLRCVADKAPVVIERTGRLDDGTPFRATSRYCETHGRDAAVLRSGEMIHR